MSDPCCQYCNSSLTIESTKQQSFDYLAKQGLQIKYDFAVVRLSLSHLEHLDLEPVFQSQLQVNENGKFSLFLNDLMKLPMRNISRDLDSRQRATRFVTNVSLSRLQLLLIGYELIPIPPVSQCR